MVSTLRRRASSPEEKEDAERGSELGGDHCWHGNLTNARRSPLRGNRRSKRTVVAWVALRRREFREKEKEDSEC
ncbi:hypothetical protein DEO72_LG11g3853 [Vigna unguiculata]|uniref:Uncharacterized protein n=1 Tax=Vigna unguiculata TaxID=3917 RepID=A0A4D6NVS4_VIGUN|nr:hypothetical protein DEO72_LG11g3853 [Vigna unguiculata]